MRHDVQHVCIGMQHSQRPADQTLKEQKQSMDKTEETLKNTLPKETVDRKANLKYRGPIKKQDRKSNLT